MENVCERFPVITQTDNDEMLKSERFYWIRIVKKYNGNFQEFHESWLKVINKTPVEIMKELFMAREASSKKQWHTLSTCPPQGSFLLCEYNVKKNFDQLIWLLKKNV